MSYNTKLRMRVLSPDDDVPSGMIEGEIIHAEPIAESADPAIAVWYIDPPSGRM